MITKEVKVKSSAGLHARPATVLAKTAITFKSKVEIELGGKKVDGKTLIGVLSLGANKGDIIKLIITGEDEVKAAEELAKIIENVD